MKAQLLDYTNWLLDMDRLKVTSQLPPFEDAEMMVEFYMKAQAPIVVTSQIECAHCGSILVEQRIYCRNCGNNFN